MISVVVLIIVYNLAKYTTEFWFPNNKAKIDFMKQESG